jgi:hypothetical protein
MAYALAKTSSTTAGNEVHNRVGIFIANHRCEGQGAFYDFDPSWRRNEAVVRH